MTRTPEQIAADDALLDAITDRFRVYELIEADEVVEQFIVAAYINGIGLQEANAARYGYATRDSGCTPQSAPVHALQGLLVRAAAWVAEPDDD